MKIKTMIILLCLTVIFLAGCGNKEKGTDTNPTPTTATNTTPTTAADTSPTEEPDVVSTASIVDSEEAFEKAIASENGTWIIAVLKDMSFDKELELAGEYKNGKKDEAGNDQIQRKIALYEQDENYNVTARYTLTAPKLTISSPEARIQSGTFKGDLYVSARNFQLVDATVEGNVYFTSEEAQSTFQMDETSKITGKQELVQQTLFYMNKEYN